MGQREQREQIGLLAKLVTNEALVRLGSGLNRLWNAAALRFPGSEKRREGNRAGFRGLTLPEGRIHGQKRQPVAGMRYGRYPMSYNGCGVIASYNALQILGVPEPLGEVAAWFERKGIVLGGLLGTDVLAAARFFRERGIRCRVLFGAGAKQPEEFDRAFSGCPAAIFAYWNNARRLRNGMHFVALSHGPDGGLAIDNFRGLDTEPCRDYGSIAEMIGKTGCAPVVLVTAEQPDQPGKLGQAEQAGVPAR